MSADCGDDEMKRGASRQGRGLVFQSQGTAGGLILDSDHLIARIENLSVVELRLRREGSSILSDSFPLPLFWRQYADHQDPERNAGSSGRLTVLERRVNSITLAACGTNASASISSRFVMRIELEPSGDGYRCHLTAELNVVSEKGWLVSPNPVQGEVEFCNFWPAGSYDPAKPQLKRFSCCVVDCKQTVLQIPHHHLETRDKAMIPLRQGDRFLWLLEDENPSIRLLSKTKVDAGVCAYMWDAHLGYKVCDQGQPVVLPLGSHFQAEIEVSTIDRETGRVLLERSVEQPIDAPDPVFHAGRLEFDRLYRSYEAVERIGLWPWQQQRPTAASAEAVRFGVALSAESADRLVLVISHLQMNESAWIAPSLGPAFGGAPLQSGRRHCFSARVRLESVDQSAFLALRMHCCNEGSVFNLADYNVYQSSPVSGTHRDWQLISVCTPPLPSAADRLHLMLVFRGSGTALFSMPQLQINLDAHPISA